MLYFTIRIADLALILSLELVSSLVSVSFVF